VYAKKPKSSFRMPNQRQTGFDKYADVEPVTAKNDKYNYQLEIRFIPQFFNASLLIIVECKCSDIIWQEHSQKFFVCLYFGNKLNNYY
jgi:hypothetical protein